MINYPVWWYDMWDLYITPLISIAVTVCIFWMIFRNDKIKLSRKQVAKELFAIAVLAACVCGVIYIWAHMRLFRVVVFAVYLVGAFSICWFLFKIYENFKSVLAKRIVKLFKRDAV